MDVQCRAQPHARRGRARPDARLLIPRQIGQQLERTDVHCAVGRAVPLERDPLAVGEGHPRGQLAIAPRCDRAVAQQLAAQARVQDVEQADVGVGDRDIQPADFVQPQADRVQHPRLERSGNAVAVPQHHRDQVFEVELDRVQIFDVVVLQHPGEIAVMRIARSALLAAEHHIEHGLGQRQVFGRAVGDQPMGERRAGTRLVEEAVFGDLGEQMGLRVIVFGQRKRLGHQISMSTRDLHHKGTETRRTQNESLFLRVLGALASLW